MATLNPDTPYGLSPLSQSSRYIATDGSGNLLLTPEGTNSSALAFYVTTSSNYASRANICTNSTGSSFCLDQSGSNVTQMVLQKPIFDSGQLWLITPVTTSNTATFWQLQSDFGGSRFLTAQGNGVYLLNNTPVEETYWQFIDFNQPSTSSTSTSASSTSTSTSTSSASSSTAVSTASSTSTTIIPSATYTPTPLATVVSHASSHPTGVIVGATIGGVAVVLIAVLAVFLILSRRKKAKARATETAEQPLSQQKYAVPFSKSTGSPSSKVYQLDSPAISEAPATQHPMMSTGFHELGGREVRGATYH